MLIVHSVGPHAGRYYLDQPYAGHWSPATGRLLGLEGGVAGRDLNRVLQGRDPASGKFLPVVRPARRRAGYDLIFAAPKSVSLLGGDGVSRAHERAVDAVMAHIEKAMGLTSTGLITATFSHQTSASGQPHVHSHVLVANLAAGDRGWSALPRHHPWKVDRVGLTGLYQLELRHQLELAGHRLEWRVGEHGLADVAAVPRASIRQASAQGALVRALGPARARQQAVPRPWPAVEIRPRAVDPAPDPGLGLRVAARLGSARSDFRTSDVWAELAAAHPGGMPLERAVEWAETFCENQVQVASPTSRARWSTRDALRLDEDLRRLLVTRGRVEVQSAGLGESGLLAHAELVRSRFEEWRAEGARVVVDAREAEAAERWRALTGLEARDRGVAADVVVVDGADRRTTSYLLTLARSHAGRLLLIEGGTQARLSNPTSHGARDAADELGRTVPAPPEPWRIDSPHMGRHPAERLLADWHAGGRRGLLVGLGAEETAALNRAARGGADQYAPGDPVIASRYRPNLPRYGTLGTIAATSPLTVDWSDGRRSVLAAGDDRHIGPAWAVTASVAQRLGRTDLHVLGRRPGLGLVEGRQPAVHSREAPGLGL